MEDRKDESLARLRQPVAIPTSLSDEQAGRVRFSVEGGHLKPEELPCAIDGRCPIKYCGAENESTLATREDNTWAVCRCGNCGSYYRMGESVSAEALDRAIAEDDTSAMNELTAALNGQSLDQLRYDALISCAVARLDGDRDHVAKSERIHGKDFLDSSKLPPVFRERYDTAIRAISLNRLTDGLKRVNQDFDRLAGTGEEASSEGAQALLRLAQIGTSPAEVVLEKMDGRPLRGRAELRRAYTIALGLTRWAPVKGAEIDRAKILTEYLGQMDALYAQLRDALRLKDQVTEGETYVDAQDIITRFGESIRILQELKDLGFEADEIFFEDTEEDKLGRELFEKM